MNRAAGFADCRRGIQAAGEADQADCIPGYHLEVKYQERLDWWASIAQAERDAKEGEEPIVVFRRNHTKWRAIIDYDVLLGLIARAR